MQVELYQGVNGIEMIGSWTLGGASLDDWARGAKGALLKAGIVEKLNRPWLDETVGLFL